MIGTGTGLVVKIVAFFAAQGYAGRVYLLSLNCLSNPCVMFKIKPIKTFNLSLRYF